jgi:hypothetical protein
VKFTVKERWKTPNPAVLLLSVETTNKSLKGEPPAKEDKGRSQRRAPTMRRFPRSNHIGPDGLK